MIRKVRMDEVRKVVEFMTAFEKETKFIKVDVEVSIKTYTEMLQTGNTHVYLMEEDGELQGAIGFILYPDIHSGYLTAVETFWYMSPEHRGKGAELLMKYENEAKKLGAKRIGMVFMQDSHPERLRDFYIKNGYELHEQHYVKEV